MIQGHFIAGQSGQLFISQYGHEQSEKTILVLPSVFEEMNLCRAVVTKQALFLARQGFCIYCLDYFGTGDSEGNIEDADASIWMKDIQSALRWLESRGVTSLSLWGIRFGALLAANCVAGGNAVLNIDRLVMWKPVAKGKMFANQFIRIKQANTMVQGDTKTDWRGEIRDGKSVEIAGYPVSEGLISSLESLVLPPTIPGDVSIAWMELGSDKITPAITNATKQWPTDRTHISCHEGSAFWQIPEIFEQSALYHETLRSFEQ